jgi:hypothetical protein
LNITPQFVSVSPNVGSIGGTVITAVVPGATVTSTDIDIVDADGDSICQTVTVVDYGVVECLTITSAIAASTQLSIT